MNSKQIYGILIDVVGLKIKIIIIERSGYEYVFMKQLESESLQLSLFVVSSIFVGFSTIVLAIFLSYLPIKW